MVLLKKEILWYMANQWYYSRKKLYGIWLTNGINYYSRKILYGIWLTNGIAQERKCSVHACKYVFMCDKYNFSILKIMKNILEIMMIFVGIVINVTGYNKNTVEAGNTF